MKVSVVIPTLNEESYLPDTLESLKNQTVQPDEIIVVDSNSSDRTKEIAKEYGCKIINKICNIGTARNCGVEKAKGEVIVFVDADTIIPPKYIARALHFLNIQDVVGYMALPELNKQRAKRWLYSRLMWFWNIFIHIRLPITGVCAIGFVVKRKTFEKIGGFDKRIGAGEDTDLEWRMRKVGRIIIDNRIKTELNFRRWERGGGYFYWTWYWVKLYFRYIFSGRTPSYYPPVR